MVILAGFIGIGLGIVIGFIKEYLDKSDEDEQKKFLAERDSKYRAAADYICDTSQRRPRETVEEITEFLEFKGCIKK